MFNNILNFTYRCVSLALSSNASLQCYTTRTSDPHDLTRAGGSNAERAECRMMKYPKCGLNAEYEQYCLFVVHQCTRNITKIRLDILCKSRKFDSRPYCSLIVTKEDSQPKITFLYLDAQ